MEQTTNKNATLPMIAPEVDGFYFGPDLQNLIINQNLNSVPKLQAALIAAEAFVSAFPKDEPVQKFEQRLLIYSRLRKKENFLNSFFIV